jgi:hypothetical protein
MKWAAWGSGRPCTSFAQYHEWRVEDPSQSPPRTLVCDKCGKHVPAAPADEDYEVSL